MERKDVGGWTLGEVVARMVELGRPIMNVTLLFVTSLVAEATK